MRKAIMEYSDPSGNIVRYIPARLTEGKEWFVYFYAEDPLTGKLKRKRVKINRIPTVRERRRFARQLIEDINERLRQGWSPWTDPDVPKGGTPLIKAMDVFLKRKRAEGLRDDTLRTYTSQCKKLREWLESTGRATVACVNFSVYTARDYMDHHIDRGISAGTYNNGLTFGKVLFNWLADHRYVADNPFDKVRKLKGQPKRREVIPVEIREKIYAHLAKTDKGFLLSCLLQFYGQLRPKEQIRMSVADIDIRRGLITVPAHAAKSGQERFVTMPKVLAGRLREIAWHELEPQAPLIGRGFRVGGERLDNVKGWWRTWDKMRRALNLPQKYQFYSLRDSGIIYLIECGVPVNQVMRQAGHTDLTITSRYVRHANTAANPAIEGLAKGF